MSGARWFVEQVRTSVYLPDGSFVVCEVRKSDRRGVAFEWTAQWFAPTLIKPDGSGVDWDAMRAAGPSEINLAEGWEPDSRDVLHADLLERAKRSALHAARTAPYLLQRCPLLLGSAA